MPNPNVNAQTPDATGNQTNSSTHSWWHPFASGTISGTFGAVLTAPFEAAKKRAQTNQVQPWKQPQFYMHPFTFTRNLFYGTSSFIASLAPTSMTQSSVNAKMKTIFPDSYVGEISGLLLSGAAGGLVSAPVEHMLLTQQKMKIGMYAASKYWYKNGLINLATACPPLIIREAIFGACMLGGAKMASEKLIALTGWDSVIIGKIRTGDVIGQLGVGVLGAAVSHPFDAIATRKQNHVLKYSTRISMYTAYQQIMAEHGIKGFYQGYGPRIGLFTLAMLSIGTANEFIMGKLSKKPASPAFFKPANQAQSAAEINKEPENENKTSLKK